MALDVLELQIQDNANQAVDGLSKLTNTLNMLKSATSNNAGLNKVVNKLKVLADVTKTLKLDGLDAQMKKLNATLAPLQNLGKSNLGSYISSLKQLPKVTESLEPELLSKFASGVNQVADAVRPLATEMDKIAMGFSAMPKRIQSFINQMNRSGKGATTAAKGYKSMGTSLASISSMFKYALSYQVIKRVGTALTGLVNTAAEYVEDINLFSVTLGKYGDAIGKYADRAQDLLGIDATQFMKYTGTFMGIADGLGVASDAAALMSQNLTQVGYDLASFWNVSNDEAMGKLQSALTGQTRTMLEFGTSVHVATLEEVALRHGIQQSISEMSEAQKVQMRYIAIMDATSAAQGDLGRTLASPSNQIRVFQQQVQLLSRSLGNIFIPVLNAVLPVLQVFVQLLRMAADAIARLFGFELPTVDYSGVSSGIGSAVDGTDDIADNLGGAAKEAKKMRDYLIGIDELNILSPDNAASAGDGSGAGVGTGGDLGIDLPTYDFLEGLESKADETMEALKKMAQPFVDAWNKAFKAIDWTPLTNAAKKLGDAFNPLGKNIADGLLWVWENVLLPIAGWQASELLPAFLDALAGAFDVLNAAIEAVKPGLEHIWNNFLVPVAQWSAGIVIDALNLLGETFTKVAGWLSDNSETINSILTNIGTILGDLWTAIEPVLNGIWDIFKRTFGNIIDIALTLGTSVLEAADKIIGAVTDDLGPAWEGLSEILEPLAVFLEDAFTSVWEDILLPVLNFFADELIPDVADTFVNLWHNVLMPLGEFIGSVLGPIFKVLSAILTLLWQNVVVPLADFIIGTFSGAWEGTSDVLNTTVIPIVGGVIDALSDLWNNILKPIAAWLVESFQPIFEGVFEALGDVIDSIKKVFGGLIDFITGVFSGDWEKAWNGVVNIFKGVVNLIPAAFELVINSIIAIVNGLTSGINLITGLVGIPEIPKIPEVTIPRLAVGLNFVPEDDFLAYLHYGEAVLPAAEAIKYRALGGMEGIESTLASITTFSPMVLPIMSGVINAGAISTPKTDFSTKNFTQNQSSENVGLDYAKLGEAVFEAMNASLQQNAELFENDPGDIVIGDETIARAAHRGSRKTGFDRFQSTVYDLG